MVAPKNTLILASSSPRRRQLLVNMGCDFKVQSADIDESRLEQEVAGDYVTRLAESKAQAVQQRLDSTETVNDISILSADTVVVKNETVFGKPRDQQHAFEIWRQLANNEHRVLTAVCLLVGENNECCTVSTLVEFADIDEKQMQQYWQSGEPQDKAGAYAIQGRASAWVKRIDGSFSNVVGLPLRETNQLLRLVGHNWL